MSSTPNRTDPALADLALRVAMTRPLVPPGLQERFAQCAVAGDWLGCLGGLVGSRVRLSLLSELWPGVPAVERATVFADTYSTADVPSSERAFVLRVLRWLAARREVAFDCEAARSAFARLPRRVTLFRGTVVDEVRSRRLGTSWTLDRARAVWFATKHVRYRNRDSEPVLLRATVRRDCIGALLLERKESEAVVHPRLLSGAATTSRLP